MKVWFWINGEEQSGNLGLVEGYIQEGINEVSLLELILVSSEPIVVDDCKKMVGSTFTLMFADRLVDKLQMSRFDGLIFEFHSLDTVAIDKDLFMYQMIVRPQIWRANYHVNAAAFPNISKPNAVKMVFESWGMGKDTDFDITLALPLI
jgi:uncharacterized protein involved in type VI secretion and phage assembly